MQLQVPTRHCRFTAVAAYVLLCTVSTLLACCKNQQQDRTLLTASGILSGRESKAYEVEVLNRGALKIILKQRGLDMRVTVRDSDSADLGTYESETGSFGDEYVVLPIARTGKFRIVVDSTKRPELHGQFDIVVSLASSASEAELAISTASKVEVMAKAQQRVSLAKSAADSFAKSKSHRQSGLAFLGAAKLAEMAGFDPAFALQLADAAAGKFSETESTMLLAEALVVGASAELDLPSPIQERKASIALKLTRAQELFQSQSNGIDEARTELFFGQLASLMGDRESASREWSRAARRCESQRDTVCQAVALQNLATVERDSGHYKSSLSTLHRALSLFDRQDNTEVFGHVQTNIGYTLRMLGDYDLSLRHQMLALQAYLDHGRCSYVSGSLYTIGYSLLGIGDVRQAVQAYQMVLNRDCRGGSTDAIRQPAAAQYNEGDQLAIQSIGSICTRIAHSTPVLYGERLYMLWTSWDLGNLARLGGNAQGALACHELAHSLAPTENNRLGTSLELIDDYISLGSLGSALAEMQKISSIFQESAGAAPSQDYYLSRARLISGRLHVALGELTVARKNLNAALEIFKRLEDREGQFMSLQVLAEMPNHHHAQAEYFLRADAMLDAIRTTSLDPTYRASLFESRRNLYATWVAAQSQRSVTHETAPATRNHRDLLATLAVSEHSRARLLLDLASGYEGLAESQALRIQMSLEAMQNAEQVGVAATNLVHDASPPRLVGMQKTLLTSNVNETISRLSAYQRQMPRTNAVIEYLLGERESFAWVLKRDSIVLVKLPPAAVIRAAVEKVSRSLERYQASPHTQITLGKMYDLIVKPIEAEIGDLDLAIVADDALHRVPFSALWDARKNRYLIERQAVSYLPSILFSLGRKPTPQSIEGVPTMLLIADPVYDAADANARCSHEGKNLKTAQGGSVSGDNLPRLAGTALEVRQIVDVVGATNGTVSERIACAANKDTLLADSLERYSLVHIAAHATADTAVLQRSAIHLSRYNQEGHEVDGSVTVADLFKSKLSARLVVLSGCATASGRLFGGDGEIGLTFAVLAAGSRQVVSTLWPAADAATTQAMGVFYAGLLKEKLPVAHALRKAQLEMISSKRWNSPQYWATFSLTG